MTNEQFCSIYSAIEGDEITSIEQIVAHSFTGEELKEFVEKFIVVTSQIDNSGSDKDKLLKLLTHLNKNVIIVGDSLHVSHNLDYLPNPKGGNVVIIDDVPDFKQPPQEEVIPFVNHRIETYAPYMPKKHKGHFRKSSREI